MTRNYRLDDDRQTLVLAAHNDRLPQIVYWGAALPAGEDLDTIHAAHTLDVTGGMLDENPDLSICPEATRSFPGQPGLILRDTDGTPLLPKFCFDSVDSTDGLKLVYADEINGLHLTATFQTDAHTKIITCQTTLTRAVRCICIGWPHPSCQVHSNRMK